MHDPREIHLQAAHHVLGFLKGTPEQGIHFHKGNDRPEKLNNDADYAGKRVNRRSTSGCCALLCGKLVS